LVLAAPAPAPYDESIAETGNDVANNKGDVQSLLRLIGLKLLILG